MATTTAIDYQANQASLFMAGITRDLEEHVQIQSQKYDFDFNHAKPIVAHDAEYQWKALP